MAKKLMMVGVVFSLALFLALTEALASEITLTSSLDISLQIQTFPAGSSYNPGSGSVSDYTNYADLDNFYRVNASQPAPGTSSVNAPAGPWLKAATASNEASTLEVLKLSSQLVGWGPQPLGDSPTNFITQEAGNRYDWGFTAPATNAYLILVTGDYNIRFQLQQGEGSSNPVYYCAAQGWVQHEVSYPGGSGGSGIGNTFQDLFYYYKYDYDDKPIPDVALDLNDSFSIGFIFSLREGDLVEGHFSSINRYSAGTLVPLPSSLLLLGSGLVGVLALGSRWRQAR